MLQVKAFPIAGREGKRRRKEARYVLIRMFDRGGVWVDGGAWRDALPLVPRPEILLNIVPACRRGSL